jgi:iron(III) transport system ATP-binding protein
MKPIVELNAVTRRYGKKTAVTDATLKLAQGRIACLLGPSGCGKSTLLRMIAGLEPVDAGEIRIVGQVVSSPHRTVPPEDRGVGLVFQDNALFPHLDVRGNVGFGLAHLPARERANRVDTLLEQLHIAHLANAWPHMLSGGEQQRVAIARALARQPALILLDEPFSGLDGMLRETVRRSLLADLRAAETTVLMVTHDPEEAMATADDLLLMAEARILQTGTPQECYRHPVDTTAARLLGEMIFLPGQILSGVIDTPLGRFPAPSVPDGRARLGLRPAALRIAVKGAPALVRDVRFVGKGYRLSLELAGEQVSIVAGDCPPAIGDEVCLTCDVDAVQVYPV